MSDTDEARHGGQQMSALEHWQIAQARKERLNRGLFTLSSWAASRAAGDHDEETTLSMLKRKVAELRDAVDGVGGICRTRPRRHGRPHGVRDGTRRV